MSWLSARHIYAAMIVNVLLAVGKAYLCCNDCECVAEAIESESGTCSSQQQQQQQRRQRKAAAEGAFQK